MKAQTGSYTLQAQAKVIAVGKSQKVEITQLSTWFAGVHAFVFLKDYFAKPGNPQKVALILNTKKEVYKMTVTPRSINSYKKLPEVDGWPPMWNFLHQHKGCFKHLVKHQVRK